MSSDFSKKRKLWIEKICDSGAKIEKKSFDFGARDIYSRDSGAEDNRAKDSYDTPSPYSLPLAPTFFPTLEEFEDPLLYIEKIRVEGERYGICLIKPPEGWNPPIMERPSNERYPTRSQRVDLVYKGAPFPDGPLFSAHEFRTMAEKFKSNILEMFHSSDTIEDIERLFWKIADSGIEKGVEVFYANDLETSKFGSGFPKREGRSRGSDYIESRVPCKFQSPEYYQKTGWNLNNMPYLEKSVLRSVKDDLQGVVVPYLYMGMLFSLFAWHNEDHYLYSVNYMHSGSPKTWYGVSALYSDAFEETLASKRAQNVFASTDELLTSITNMMSPIHLVSKNVPVYRLVQEPRTFVVTFPQAYHSGFSHGLNLSEACNLALPDWIPYGRKAVERYSQSSSFRTSLFAHDQLVCSLAQDYKSHSPYIVDELTRIINAEELGRQKAINDGLVILVQLKNSYDLRGECYFCRSICYLSCVVCRCEKTRNPNRVVSCLKHIPSLCSCDPSEKVLCYWYTIQSLRSLLGVISKKSDCDKR